MKVVPGKSHLYCMELSAEEANWLREYAQNYANPGEESPNQYRMRKALFDALACESPERAHRGLHPYHCPLDGEQLVEVGLGILECRKCDTQFLPMYKPEEDEYSIVWLDSDSGDASQG